MFLSIVIIIILNCISDKLLTSLSFSSSSGEFSYFFFWGMFLCLSILAASLCLFYALSRSAKTVWVPVSDAGCEAMANLFGTISDPQLWLPLLGLFVCRKY